VAAGGACCVSSTDHQETIDFPLLFPLQYLPVTRPAVPFRGYAQCHATPRGADAKNSIAGMQSWSRSTSLPLFSRILAVQGITSDVTLSSIRVYIYWGDADCGLFDSTLGETTVLNGWSQVHEPAYYLIRTHPLKSAQRHCRVSVLINSSAIYLRYRDTY
jgi:hypothetical protein